VNKSQVFKCTADTGTWPAVFSSKMMTVLSLYFPEPALIRAQCDAWPLPLFGCLQRLDEEHKMKTQLRTPGHFFG
jgi:hypothetical protein